MKKICLVCGKDFSVSPSNFRRIKNCSMKCHSLWQSKNRIGKKGGNWRGGKIKKACVICNKTFFVFPHASTRRKTCSKKCQFKYQREVNCGPNHPNWKGGKHIAPNGYVIISVKGKTHYEHRFIMEQFLGRKLKTKECVHHKNGIKTDNRSGNLELVSLSQHKKLKHPEAGSKTRFKTKKPVTIVTITALKK